MLTFCVGQDVCPGMACVLFSLWITVLTGAGVAGPGGAVAPGLGRAAVTEGYEVLPDQDLSHSSQTHLCYAQCMAKCIDQNQVRNYYLLVYAKR